MAALSFHRDREDFERFSSPLWAERFADHGAELLLIDALQLDAHPSRDANIRRPEVYVRSSSIKAACTPGPAGIHMAT